MGQNWKPLGLIVVGAAIAGWLMVRTLSGSANHRGASPTGAVATIAEPQHQAVGMAPANTNPSPPAAPAAPASPTDADETAVIERDLGILARSLPTTRQVEDRAMPEIRETMRMPSSVTYRRAANFWESAFARPAEMNP